MTHCPLNLENRLSVHTFWEYRSFALNLKVELTVYHYFVKMAHCALNSKKEIIFNQQKKATWRLFLKIAHCANIF